MLVPLPRCGNEGSIKHPKSTSTLQQESVHSVLVLATRSGNSDLLVKANQYRIYDSSKFVDIFFLCIFVHFAGTVKSVV